jgi:hypothetical protein
MKGESKTSKPMSIIEGDFDGARQRFGGSTSLPKHGAPAQREKEPPQWNSRTRY